MASSLKYVRTSFNVSMLLNGQVCTIDASDPVYPNVMALIDAGAKEKSIQSTIARFRANEAFRLAIYLRFPWLGKCLFSQSKKQQKIVSFC